MSHFDTGIGITRIGIDHVPQFGGNIWYVNKGIGADTNSGKFPHDAFETIGAGLDAMASGDAVSVKAGTYTETGLDLGEAGAKDYVELWCELGTTIDPASGDGLTVSGVSCKVSGNLKITPVNASDGLVVSGAECVVSDVKILEGANNFTVSGAGVILNRCAAGFPDTGGCGYNITGAQARLRGCNTVGDTTSYGYKINNGSDTGALIDCTSTGHATSGFYIDTGSVNWTLLNCSSGGGDGRWIDVDQANVWANFSFDDLLCKELTLDGGAAGTFEDDLYLVTGVVQINYIYGIVETAISADVDVAYLDLFPTGGAAIEITDNGGATLDDIKAGSMVSKQGLATVALIVEDSNLGFVSEYTGNFRNSLKPFVVGKKNGAVTNIRFVYDTGGSATGKICWMVKWSPISDDGFLAVV